MKILFEKFLGDFFFRNFHFYDFFLKNFSTQKKYFFSELKKKVDYSVDAEKHYLSIGGIFGAIGARLNGATGFPKS